jgi:hypothetical protein
MKFQVSQKPGVIEQVRRLHEVARKNGIETKYVLALKQMVQHLETRPLEWGDPEYHLIHEGSVVCHGVIDPIIVRFAVYPIEIKVYVLDIKAASDALTE